MRIGIIGTGRMGSALGTLWATKRNHQVFFGSRKRMKSDALAQIAGSGSQGGIYEEAAEFGEVVVLAVPWSVTEAVVTRLAPYLAGKVLIDMTNALAPARDGLLLDGNTSAAQIIQELVPESHVVKAFNGVPFQLLDSPKIDNHLSQVFYCGNDKDARGKVFELITDLGFVGFDMGGLANARYIEAMTYVWIMHMANAGAGKTSIINIVSGD